MQRRSLRSLCLALVLGLLGLALVAPPAPVLADASTDGDEWELLELTNRARAQAGLAPLVPYGPVRDLARRWTATMAAENRLYHNPNLSASMTALAPDWQRGGENVGRGTDVGSLHQAFMSSPGHRANVLGDFNYVGVGVVHAGTTTWVTLNFLKAPAGKPALTRVPLTRIGGANDTETSVAVSRRFPAGQSDAVVVGRVDVFADALAGGPLAAVKRGPVLLTGSTGVVQSVLDEARRVLEPGGTVFLLGGPAALSPAVEAAFAGAGLRTERLAGADRYETAVIVARRVNPSPTEVIVASGVSFADAMVAGAPAGALAMPIVLTAQDLLPTPTAAYLAMLTGVRRTVVGGPAVVSELAAVAAGATDRIWGADRYETSVKVAQRWFGSAAQLSFATGATFQDALAGSPFSARAGIPVVLTSPVPTAATESYVHSRLPSLVGSIAYGNANALPDAALGSLLS